jgi:integrase
MTFRGKAPYSYRPIYALPYWDIVGPFVVDAVTDTASESGRDERALYPAAVAFVLWCWQTRGTPLQRTRIFRQTTLDEFIHRGMVSYLNGSKATYRSALRLMIETLNPTDTTRSARALHRSAPTQPYTSREVAALHSWAAAQGTQRRKGDAITLLALGLGAGLATRELLGIRVRDLIGTADTIHVVVRQGRTRVVPLSEPWARPLRRILPDLSMSDWIFRPGRQSAADGQITDFLLRSRTELDVRPSRMRATWLLEHLTGGTPPEELLRISGLKNYAALDKIRLFTPTPGAARIPAEPP